jgi:hypothetical protein
MNGTVIDIKGITINVVDIYLQDSTDIAQLLTIKDKDKTYYISILNETIKEVRCSK